MIDMITELSKISKEFEDAGFDLFAGKLLTAQKK